ncbi:Uncharacterized protein BP5553_04741 [Venustampulla echinocandica]|uniref:Structural maintenance of chromosomes protein 5 n=1 Tax=Venustampulla echinocandica TaxID=2656787 RepID=A0A370TP82_9HELO|nr:Uncharacterized protein BP5553_04741 [Venustampulla echinocandica]RDL37308.1 Uncharacterized protein BP5553_04741 [Venustampulla echinocandica]
MSSLLNGSRRRRRLEFEDEEDADPERRSERSTPSVDSAKRVRTNGYMSDSQTPSPPRLPSSRRRHGNPSQDEHLGGDSSMRGAGPNHFQPGAIVRVKLTNFVTYENAEFYPGPNLNMVIGPNGTGKSSLVCAICLGLGWGPVHLGRAQQIGEFVKHEMNDAFVEIELQKRPTEPRNHVVRLRIIRDGNSREFWLDDRKTSLKHIQALTRAFNIQVDNLCQFLPQDKVSEFAALSPVELLQQTQRAAAPPEMLEQHDALKKIRRDQKSLELQHEADKEHLEGLESRQENLRVEVQRLEERNQIQEKVSMLEKSIPFVEYRIARLRHLEVKTEKENAQRRFRNLEAELEPTLQSIKHTENYQQQISAVVQARRVAVGAAELEASELIKRVEVLDENIMEIGQSADAERVENKKRTQELQAIQRKIIELKARLNDAPIEFNASEWNERIREKEHKLREINAEIREIVVQDKELMGLGKEVLREVTAEEEAMATLDTQEGIKMSRLEKVSKETADAWKWVQDNPDEFEKEVHGPPLITCSVKDPRYANAIESLLRRTDYLTITAQTHADFKKLQDQLLGKMNLADFPVRRTDGSGDDGRRPLSAQDKQHFGLDGWAVDFIDGPGPVLSMLCESLNMHRTGISLQDITDDQFDAIIAQGQLNTWVAGTNYYKVSRRREYGPQAVSTNTRTVGPARYWIDQPVDTSAKEEMQTKIDSLKSKFEALKAQIRPLRLNKNDLMAKVKDIEGQMKEIKNDKAEIQKVHGQQAALPDKIKREEEALEEKRQSGVEFRARLKKLQIQHDHAVLRKAKVALDHKELVAKIRASHEELLEAEIRLIEATSDVEALTERNRDIHQHLEDERRQVKQMEDESKEVKRRAASALQVCQEIRSDPANERHLEHFGSIPHDMTIENLEMEIQTESSKLEYVHANNPNAIKDFERRQVEVNRLQEKAADTERKLERMGRQITEVRGRWEPALDKLIEEISEAFSYNFEQIGCAGEVSVHKDDDFDNWAIQIRVKFRENETLQLLNQHRQSGGERSVSTIFYLMSLQSLARAPFRVVDEINQGMDPRNERMVHERMVEIACKEHTSQYFLITPKLLTGLRYDERMKVLCIASGEHMPDNYKQLDVSKIIGIRRAIMAAS